MGARSWLVFAGFGARMKGVTPQPHFSGIVGTCSEKNKTSQITICSNKRFKAIDETLRRDAANRYRANRCRVAPAAWDH